MKRWWPERLTALLAVTFLSLPVALLSAPRTDVTAATDFKTLYASASCFARGASAYSLPGIAAVFTSGGVVLPPDWYGRASVYPPFTLALIAPLTALPMLTACRVWLLFSAALFACALAALARLAAERYQLPRVARLLLILLCAASPLSIIALLLGNVSVVVAALCILAACAHTRPMARALMLAAALLLKPHTAFWVLVALLFVPNLRILALRAAALASAAAALVAAWLAFHGRLALQLSAYRAILHSELTAGSMNAHTSVPLAIPAQLTALPSLLAQPLATFILATLLGLLLLASIRIRHRILSPELLIGAWCAFGLIATYHRAHDSLVLLLVLPIAFARLRRSARDLPGWLIILFLAALSIPGATFLNGRRAACAAFLLALLLIGLLFRAPPPRPGDSSLPA